jgi:hypothetical protein
MPSPRQAVAEFEMGDLQPGAGAVDCRVALATVELEGISRCKLQGKAGVFAGGATMRSVAVPPSSDVTRFDVLMGLPPLIKFMAL